MPTLPKSIIYILIGCFILFIGLTGFSIHLLLGVSKVTKKPILIQVEQEKDRFSKAANGIEYEKRMIEYYAMQSMAVDIFPIDTTSAGREKSLSDIKDIGIYYWNRNLAVLESLKELDMPKELVQRTELLKEYCQLNKTCYTLMYKAIDQRTNQYDNEIQKHLKQIADQLDLIKRNDAP